MQPLQSIRTLGALSLVLVTAFFLPNQLTYAEQGDALYDNLEQFRPREGDGVFSATGLKAILAQPFTSGENGTISSVKFPVERFGNPTGVVPVEIWDDEDGLPGKKIATVGEFDISKIALRRDGGEILHFEPEISGLVPDQTYYLLTDDTGTDVTDISNTYGVPTTPDHGDANTGKMLGSADGGATWNIVGDIQTGRNYRIMEIQECPPAPDETTLYDNFPDPLPQFMQGGGDGVGAAGPPGPSELQPLHAQPFLTNEWGTVDEVIIYIVGTPEVEGTIDVVLTADDGGFPGETVKVLGTIDLETLTVWDQAPTLGDLLTFEANLTGLKSNARYYIGFDITKMAPVNGRFPNATFFNLFREEDEGTNGAGVNLVGPFGEWKPLSNFVELANHMLMRITASPPTTIEFPIPKPGEGMVTITPEQKFYAIGSTVTVTASPNEAFAFVKWLYGDQEFTENPADITVQAGVTLTPVFVRRAPPLNIDVAPAIAVSWDSQSGIAYQIHRSIDMEDWVLAVDDIAGTGERMSHYFVRDEAELFYRVEALK